MKRVCFLLLLFILFIIPNANANASVFTVILGWKSGSNNLLEEKGYKVCYGTESRVYTKCYITGGYTYTVTTLPRGVKHYFSVKTIGWNGTESAFTNEVWTDGYKTNYGDPDGAGGCFIIILF